MVNAADRAIEQLALFLNGRDTAESGTAVWEKLPIDARESYLRDAEAILGAVRLLDAAPVPGDERQVQYDNGEWSREVETVPEVPADEREALIRLLEVASDEIETAADMADALLAAGFRRQGPITERVVGGFFNGDPSTAEPGVYVPRSVMDVLEAVWDDGNAVGLDGWVGPGRGTEPIDNEALLARDRAIEKYGPDLCPGGPITDAQNHADDLLAYVNYCLGLPMYQNAISEFGQGAVETLRMVKRTLDAGLHADARAAALEAARDAS